MRISIVGPGKFEKYTAINSRAKEIITLIARAVAESGNEIVITPDKNSAISFFGREYLKNNGKKIFEIAPLDDKKWGYKKYLDMSLGKIINCGTWDNQPQELNKQSELMICLAYGTMVMAEIAYTTYYKPKKIYIIKEFITSELPRELNRSLDIEYIGYKHLIKILGNLKKK